MIASEQHERLREVARLLTQRAPVAWQRLELVFRCTVSVSSATFHVTNALGVVEATPTPMAVSRLMDRLRGDMAEEGRGSWFTAVLVIEPPGRYEISFDYDSEPDFVPALLPSAWRLDHEYYPRSPEHTPDWLRAKLAEEPKSTTESV